MYFHNYYDICMKSYSFCVWPKFFESKSGEAFTINSGRATDFEMTLRTLQQNDKKANEKKEGIGMTGSEQNNTAITQKSLNKHNNMEICIYNHSNKYFP